MTPEEKLDLADAVMQCVLKCPYCDACTGMVKEYLSTLALADQMEKEAKELSKS